MATTSSIQVVNDANGSAYGFLSNDGQLLQCRWDSQAERWLEAQPVPGALGSNTVQATYLDNLWANEAGGSNAQGQSWDPGIVLLYRKGQDSQAEIYAVFGGWNDNGDLQWSREVQLTDDTVNDKEFSLVAADNGQFVLVTQKQQEVQSLAANPEAVQSGSLSPEQAAQLAINGLVRPDSDLYTTSFQILNNGPGKAPELQGDPIKATPTSSPTWTSIASLESTSQPTSPAPPLPDGSSGGSNGLSQAALFAPAAMVAGVSSAAMAASEPSGLGASTPTGGAWEVGRKKNPSSVQVGYLAEVTRWGVAIPWGVASNFENPGTSLDKVYKALFIERWGGQSRAVFSLTGFFGFTNQAGVLAFRSQAIPTIGLLIGGQEKKKDASVSRYLGGLKDLNAITNDAVGFKVVNKKFYRLALSGSTGSTTYYDRTAAHNPTFLQARESLSINAGLVRKNTWANISAEGIPSVTSFDFSASNAFGYQWFQSIGNGKTSLPSSISKGTAGKVIGGIGDAESFLTFVAGLGVAFTQGVSNGGTLIAGEKYEDSKFFKVKNFANAILGLSTALIDPVYLSKNSSEYQATPGLNYKRKSGFYDTFQVTLEGKYMAAFGLEGTALNKSNSELLDAGNATTSYTFLAELAVGAFGTWQPVLSIDNTYSGPKPASTRSSSNVVNAAAPAPSTDGGSFVYAPSQGSSLYWAPSTGAHLLSGAQTQPLFLQTLIASSANLMQASSLNNGGSGLNNGTYTNVRLVGVTPGGEDDLAEATVVVAGGQITSLVITRGGTYAYLPPYSLGNSQQQPQQVVVVPDLVSVNASNGSSIVNSGAIGKGLASPPTIILTSSATGSWSSKPAAVIQSVVVSDGGSGYAPFDANTQEVKPLPVDNASSYVYTGVGYSVYQGSNPVASLVTGSAASTTATVTLINGAIARVSLDQPF